MRVLYNIRLSDIVINENVFDNFKKRGEHDGCLFGCLSDDYGITANVKINNVSHNVKNLKLVNNYIYGDVEILDTPCGKKLEEAYDNNKTVVYGIVGTQQNDKPVEIHYIESLILQDSTIISNVDIIKENHSESISIYRVELNKWYKVYMIDPNLSNVVAYYIWRPTSFINGGFKYDYYMFDAGFKELHHSTFLYHDYNTFYNFKIILHSVDIEINYF